MKSKRRKRSRKTKASQRCPEAGNCRWTAQRRNSQGVSQGRSKFVKYFIFLANPFFDPFFLFSNPACCLLFHRISVTFNVNNSIPPNFEEEAEQGQQKSGEEEVCWTQADLLNLLCLLKNHFAHCLQEMNYKVLKSLFLSARNCVNTKLCCRSNKTGLKTFTGVWLSFPWRRGMQRWKPAAYFFPSSPSFIQFAVFIYLFF